MTANILCFMISSIVFLIRRNDHQMSSLQSACLLRSNNFVTFTMILQNLIDINDFWLMIDIVSALYFGMHSAVVFLFSVSSFLDRGRTDALVRQSEVSTSPLKALSNKVLLHCDMNEVICTKIRLFRLLQMPYCFKFLIHCITYGSCYLIQFTKFVAYLVFPEVFPTFLNLIHWWCFVNSYSTS